MLGEHVFWITSRSAGTAALLLSSASVAALVALAVHALSLLGDSYLRLSVADVMVPLASGYKEPWMSIGIVAGWGLMALGLSYYVRVRIGVTRWRRLHRLTAVAWVAGLVHSLGEGTDAGSAWFLVATAIVVVPALALLVLRHTGPAGRRESVPS